MILQRILFFMITQISNVHSKFKGPFNCMKLMQMKSITKNRPDPFALHQMTNDDQLWLIIVDNHELIIR